MAQTEGSKDVILTTKGMLLTPEKTQSMIEDWMAAKANIPTVQVGEYIVTPADEEKLRAAGYTDAQIAALDLRNGGNVDDEGNVLYLDDARLARKEHPNQPMYENAPDATEGYPAMWEYISQNIMESKPSNWEMVKDEFRAIGTMAAAMNDKPGVSTAKEFELGMGLGGSTHGVMLPLNVDLTDDPKAKSVTVPMDLIDQAIDMAEFIGGMRKCVCRDKEQCEHFPIEGCACLFFNMAGKKVVANGLADELTKEEAKARVRKAAELGLVGNALWIEVEQLVWGFMNSKMTEFFEICFCCPCCCVAQTCARVGGRQAAMFLTPSGFTATVDHRKCVGCKKCSQWKVTCPEDAISYRPEDGKMVVNQEFCIGCGLCKRQCEHDAIKIQQTMPMRESIHEHFVKEARIDLVIDKCTV